MPFKSAKQETFLAINKPDLYRKWARKYGTRVQPKKPDREVKGK